MSNIGFTIKCGRCNGTGIDDNKKDVDGNPIPESCTSCNGTGYLQSGLIDITDIINRLDWIKKKIKKILNKLDIPEEEE